MKKTKILAIALFSVFISMTASADIAFSGTCVNWDIDNNTITCAPSQQVCFAIDNIGCLYFPDLGIKGGDGYRGAVEVSPGTWQLIHE